MKISISIPTLNEARAIATTIWSQYNKEIIAGGSMLLNGVLYTRLQHTRNDLHKVLDNIDDWDNADHFSSMLNKSARNAVKQSTSTFFNVHDHDDNYEYTIIKLKQPRI